MARRITNRSTSHLFRDFHGRAPTQRTKAGLFLPNTLIQLGRAVSIVYEIDKKNGGGDGTIATYEHEFETPVGLFMDERAKMQLYLMGKDLIVTRNGIEN